MVGSARGFYGGIVHISLQALNLHNYIFWPAEFKFIYWEPKPILNEDAIFDSSKWPQ